MNWVAPSEKDTAAATLEKRLWDTADQFRANSGLKVQEYSGPILGIIFLRFAEVRFAAKRKELEKEGVLSRRGSRVDDLSAYHAEGILYLPKEARFDYLLNLPEAENIGAKVNAAMRDAEKHNPQLAGTCPRPTISSPERCSRNCSRRRPKFRPRQTTTPLAAFMNISSASSPAPKDRKAASSIHLRLLSACSRKLSSPITDAFSTPPVVPAVCSSSLRALFEQV